MNIICTGDGRFIEVQGTAERAPFTEEQMNQLLALARKGIEQLITVQRETLANFKVKRFGGALFKKFSPPLFF